MGHLLLSQGENVSMLLHLSWIGVWGLRISIALADLIHNINMTHTNGYFTAHSAPLQGRCLNTEHVMGWMLREEVFGFTIQTALKRFIYTRLILEEDLISHILRSCTSFD